MNILRRSLPAILFMVCLARCGWTQDLAPAAAPKEEKPADPFAGVQPDNPGQTTSQSSWVKRFFSNNFTLKKELYFQLTAGYKVEADPPLYSRQSVGFELLKKFSTHTATIGAFDLQSRLVRRDNYRVAEPDNEKDRIERIKSPATDEKAQKDVEASIRGIRKNLILLDVFIYDHRFEPFYQQSRAALAKKKS